MRTEVRRAGDRFVTRSEGRTTWHSFSFGAHYDPAVVGFGALVAHNDEHLPPGTGYDAHRHRDLEIVTVVLAGSLRHTSDVGDGVLGPGDVQRLSAGTGVTHREWSAVEAAVGPDTRFVQTWLRPHAEGGRPSYAVVRDALAHDALAVVETGARADAVLRGGTLRPGTTALLAARADEAHHVFVAGGSVDLTTVTGTTDLAAGDAARSGGHPVEQPDEQPDEQRTTLTARTTATVLVWTTRTI